MVKQAYFGGIDGYYSDITDRLDAEKSRDTKTDTTNMTDPQDVFFFYPLYLKDEIQAKKLLKIYAAHKKNQAKIAKEILDMSQLLDEKTVNMNKSFGENLYDQKYLRIFEDFIRRTSGYEQNSGERLFKDSEDIRKYIKYLITTTDLTLNNMETAQRAIEIRDKRKRR